jgi:hypothetical protein
MTIEFDADRIEILDIVRQSQTDALGGAACWP